MNITTPRDLTPEERRVESAKRMIELHPKSDFTFPHLTLDCRVSLIADLLKQHGY